MYNFAIQLFLALSIGTLTTAVDLIGSVTKAPPAEVDRRLQALCSCSPRTFTFRIRLDQDQFYCNDNTLQGKPGVTAASCDLTGNIVAPITSIESILIRELDQNLNLILSETLPGPFNDGNEFMYTSGSELNPDVPLEDQEVPGGMEIYLTGSDVAGSNFYFQVTWRYDLTNCEAEPITIGDKIGPIEVVGYTPAKSEFCPVIGTDPDTNGSMSYSASFSLAHISKASKKGKATKGVVSKSGKLIRERN